MKNNQDILASTPKKKKVISLVKTVTPQKRVIRKTQQDSRFEYCIICQVNFKISGILKYKTLQNKNVLESLKRLLPIDTDIQTSRLLRVCRSCADKCTSLLKREEKLKLELEELKKKFIKTNEFFLTLETGDWITVATKRMSKLSPIKTSEVFKKKARASEEIVVDEVDDECITPLQNVSLEDSFKELCSLSPTQVCLKSNVTTQFRT